MSDLSITAANVHWLSGRILYGAAGQAITAGQAVAYDSSDGKYYLADNDSGTAARKAISGVALDSATGNGYPLRVQVSGIVWIAATVSPGVLYFVSSTAGGIAPYADLGTGDDVIIVGVGGGPDPDKQHKLTLICKDSGIAIP